MFLIIFVKIDSNMKKLVSVFIAVFAVSVVFAQDFRFGPVVGGNIAKLAGDSEEGARTAVLGGAFIGLMGEYQFNDRFGARAEVFYSQQGDRVIWSVPVFGRFESSSWTLNSRSNNVIVPVMATFDIVEEKFRVMAGPTFGFCFGGKDFHRDMSGKGPSDYNEKWTKNDYNVFDIGVVAGLEFVLGEHFGIFARYNWGFKDVFKSGLLDEPRSYGKNRVLQIGLEYKFGD